jgi:hypothetical protein
VWHELEGRAWRHVALIPRGAAILTVLCRSVLIINLDGTVLNVARPRIVATVHIDAAQRPWIVDAYVVVLAALSTTLARAVRTRRRLRRRGADLTRPCSAVAGERAREVREHAAAFVLLGAGTGLVIAPSTDSVMGSVPIDLVGRVGHEFHCAADR